MDAPAPATPPGPSLSLRPLGFALGLLAGLGGVLAFMFARSFVSFGWTLLWTFVTTLALLLVFAGFMLLGGVLREVGASGIAWWTLRGARRASWDEIERVYLTFAGAIAFETTAAKIVTNGAAFAGAPLFPFALAAMRASPRARARGAPRIGFGIITAGGVDLAPGDAAVATARPRGFSLLLAVLAIGLVVIERRIILLGVHAWHSDYLTSKLSFLGVAAITSVAFALTARDTFIRVDERGVRWWSWRGRREARWSEVTAFDDRFRLQTTSGVVSIEWRNYRDPEGLLRYVRSRTGLLPLEGMEDELRAVSAVHEAPSTAPQDLAKPACNR